MSILDRLERVEEKLNSIGDSLTTKSNTQQNSNKSHTCQKGTFCSCYSKMKIIIWLLPTDRFPYYCRRKLIIIECTTRQFR